MRLHRLEVTAFGPFADTVEVDFDAVGVTGLFLVHGPTGAGKTSLLDAICFALYAGVPGARPAGRALRSDHAGRGAVPRVRLEFGVAQRRFRITRSPEFRRPKRRGPGETTSPAQVVLEEHVHGRWTGRSTRADEVGDIVTEVLGMGLDQFSKVVLLPQGEFAAFLRATADERRTLLEKLFDVSTFSGVETWLAERRRTLAVSLGQERALLTTDLARLRDVLAAVPGDSEERDRGGSGAGLDPPGEEIAWDAVSVESLPIALAELHERLARHASTSLADAERRDRAAVQASERHTGALAVADLQRRGAAARHVLADMQADPSSWTGLAGLAHTAAVATRAEAVSGDLRAMTRARRQVADLASRLETVRAQVPDIGLLVEIDASDHATAGGAATVVALVDELAGHMGALDDAVGAQRRAAEEEARLLALRRDLSVAERSEAERQAALARATEGVAAATRLLTGVDRIRAEHEQAKVRVAQLERLHAVSRDLDVAGAAEQGAADAVRHARDAEQDARDTHLRLRQARLDGMAAELATSLVDGEPCVVCGGVEHPAPARAEEPVSAEAVDSTDRRWRNLAHHTLGCAQTHAAARQLVVTRSADLTLALEELANSADSPESGGRTGWDSVADQGQVGLDRSEIGRERPSTARVAVAVDAARQDRAHLAQEVARLERAGAELSAARTRQERLADGAVALASGIAAARSTVAELEARLSGERATVRSILAAHRLECPCARRTPADETDGATTACIPEVADLHTRTAAALQDLAAALVAAGKAAADCRTVQEAARETLTAAGFRSEDEARQALLDPEELRDLRARLRAADDRRAAADATLADAEVVAAMGAATADPAGAAAEVEAARQALRRAQHRQSVAETAARSFEQLHAGLLLRVTTLGPLVREAAEVAELADTVTGIGGQNALRMRLTAFVLAARLEKVAALANERLLVMGDGRYQLAHTDDLASGGRRSGLGLVVRDQWTGHVRDTASLSGGESFMASLALALGLADAVREEAGGFDLNTLFIDEGFGTLDEESLEQVMAVLDGLRDGGRCVGVVSHVSDLRSRVPAQVRVDKTATGSTVTILGLDTFAA